jgi:hypothetical protein
VKGADKKYNLYRYSKTSAVQEKNAARKKLIQNTKPNFICHGAKYMRFGKAIHLAQRLSDEAYSTV